MKLFSRFELIPISLIAFYGLCGYFVYPLLPDRVPIHWGIDGAVDGYGSKMFTVIFFPALAAALYVLLTFIPRFDPLRANIEAAGKEYFLVKLAALLFFGGIYALILAESQGIHTIPLPRGVLLGIAGLFGVIGSVLPRIKRNYTIGIRLPWTLESDTVWEKTHRFGRSVFLAIALLSIGSSFLSGAISFIVFFVGLITALLTIFVYAYRAHAAERAKRA